AVQGMLVEDEHLSKQVNRMLADVKLKRFCDSFPTQWLQLDRIISAVPDEKKYRDFYYGPPLYRTTMDMMMEPLLLFETVLIEDRSVLELIDSIILFVLHDCANGMVRNLRENWVAPSQSLLQGS
ncbi:MAG: DUF1592 domain-containing protein, partial [Opitutae bacterium]